MAPNATLTPTQIDALERLARGEKSAASLSRDAGIRVQTLNALAGRRLAFKSNYQWFITYAGRIALETFHA